MGDSSNNSLVSTVLSAIFGDKIGGLVNAVAGYAGISNSSSNSLLNMVTGASLGSLGKYAADNNLDASGLSGLLKDQKGVVSSLLPAGLSLASLASFSFNHLTLLANASLPNLFLIKLTQSTVPVE